MRIWMRSKRLAAVALLIALCATCAGAQAQGRYGDAIYLRMGMRSTAVRQMQEDLQTLDIYSGSVTGHFGELTEAAVRRFQQKNGLTVDGIAGAKTLAALAALVTGGTVSSGTTGTVTGSSGTLTLNSTGEAVRALQENLHILGYYDSSITGHYGKLTKEAVRQFQKKNGLTADGVAGARTLNKIYSMLADGGSAGTSGGVSGPSTTPAPATVKLNKGSSGEIVRQLQENLHTLGYYDGVISGSYGNLTKEAVRQFQKEHDLTADGIAGPRTLSKVAEEIARKNGTAGSTPQATPSPDTSAGTQTPAPSTGTTVALLDTTRTLRYGNRSEDVRKLQNALITLGYFDGSATAYFGTQTANAVKDYQEDKNLTVDGIAGRNTLTHINTDLQNAANKSGASVIAAAANGAID